MAATIKQLTLSRKARHITRKALAERLDCSYSWLRSLEEGRYDGSAWRDRYEAALAEIIEERRQAKVG